MAVVAAPTARPSDTVASYLKRPYTRTVVPEEDGTFRAEILEFPGCIAIGDTAEEALATLEEVAAEWLAAALSRGQKIPEPVDQTEFSGRFLLRLPKSLHRKSAILAARDGVSLNQFIVSAVSEYVGIQSTGLQQTQIRVVNIGSNSLSVGGGGYYFVGTSEQPEARVQTIRAYVASVGGRGEGITEWPSAPLLQRIPQQHEY